MALSSLLGGTTTGEFVSVVGFGSGSTAPVMGDTGLGANPSYYNAVGTIIIGPNGGVATGSVQFGYQLQVSDYAANPLTIQELGLFGNTGGASFPAAVATGFSGWSANTAETIGNLIVDSNGNIQRVTAVSGDTKTGGGAPTWQTSLSATTTDNHVTWTLVALHTAPTPMVAHVVVPNFPYTGAGNFSGTWTISM